MAWAVHVGDDIADDDDGFAGQQQLRQRRLQRGGWERPCCLGAWS